ncbi:MAG: DUF4214 domain-containing protein, partial [Coriobacteriia bacterium]
FSGSAEYAALYAGQSNEQIINNLYLNLFGRNAEPAGLVHWAGQLAAGTQTFASIALQLTFSAQDTDATAIANKLAASTAFTTALDTTAEIVGYSGTGAAASARSWLATVSHDAATLTTALAGVDAAVTAAVAGGAAATGQAFMLTAGIDTMPGLVGSAGTTGTAANDVINSTNTTLTALDSIDGGAGNDILNILNAATGTTASLPGSLTVSNVETVNVRSAHDVGATGGGANTFNISGFTGATTFNVTQAANVYAQAATTTDVNVSGATGDIQIDGGKNIAVTTATADKATTIGATTVNAGTITVTDTNQGSGNIAIDGGTDVTLTASARTTGTIKVGDTGAANVAADMASGAVNVTVSEALADGEAAVAITVEGGSSITITENITASAAALTTASTDTTPGNITGAAISATGGAATTSITVNQTAASAAVPAVTAATAVSATTTATFSAVTAGTAVTVNGLTFTAAVDLTAAQVAAAFSNLSAGDTQSPTGPTSKGTYSGASANAWTTGAVTNVSSTSSTVTFTAPQGTTAVTAATNATISVVGTGTAGATGVTGVLGVVNGAVTVDGNITGADVLATVSLNAYGAGSTVASDALTTLNLANSAQDLVVTNATATTLALGLNNIATGSTIDLDNAAANQTYKTLNITTSGTNSDVTLTAAAVETLTVAGDKSVDLTGATLTALKTVTVSGSAGLTINASGANVTAVNTSATTGTVTATVDASKATYTGGAGVDAVTLSATTVDKAVNLGAGNDTLTLASGTTSLTSEMIGGDGTDTLVMVAADAATASSATTFETKITGFEKLSISDTVGTGVSRTVNMANMDDIDYVISANTYGSNVNVTESAVVTFTDMTAGQTITIDGITMTAVANVTAAEVAEAFDNTAAGLTDKLVSLHGPLQTMLMVQRLRLLPQQPVPM